MRIRQRQLRCARDKALGSVCIGQLEPVSKTETDRSPNDEIRYPKEIRTTKSETSTKEMSGLGFRAWGARLGTAFRCRHSDFGLLSDLGFRISDFTSHSDFFISSTPAHPRRHLRPLSGAVIRISGFFRISDFGFRISPVIRISSFHEPEVTHGASSECSPADNPAPPASGAG